MLKEQCLSPKKQKWNKLDFMMEVILIWLLLKINLISMLKIKLTSLIVSWNQIHRPVLVHIKLQARWANLTNSNAQKDQNHLTPTKKTYRHSNQHSLIRKSILKCMNLGLRRSSWWQSHLHLYTTPNKIRPSIGLCHRGLARSKGQTTSCGTNHLGLNTTLGHHLLFPLCQLSLIILYLSPKVRDLKIERRLLQVTKSNHQDSMPWRWVQ